MNVFPATLKQKKAIGHLLERFGGNTENILESEMSSEDASHFLRQLVRKIKGQESDLD